MGRLGWLGVLKAGKQDLLAPFFTTFPFLLHSIMRTKVYAVLELWVQVCGASAGVLQGGASGEALLTHLLSDISPPAETLKVIKGSAYPRRLCPVVPFV